MSHQEVLTPWGPKRTVSTPFLAVAVAAFPVILLLVASVQPAVFRDKSTVWYSLSVGVLTLHGLIFVGTSLILLSLIGRLRLLDLGLQFSKVSIACGIMVAVWLGEQVLLLAAVPLGWSDLQLNAIWLSSPDTVRAISRLVANTIGTGLNEETFFRGFVFVHMYLVFSRRRDQSHWNLGPLIAAALVSALCFALCHFRTDPVDFLQLMLGGVLGAGLYARSKNLFVGIGLHGLFNSPMPCLECSTGTAKLTVIVIMVALIFCWRNRDDKRTLAA